MCIVPQFLTYIILRRTRLAHHVSYSNAGNWNTHILPEYIIREPPHRSSQ